ncbi:cation:proton antiporter [Nakamurella aerolata]|uniref:Sodium:proton antiporter n=1 Tax=Nakamurella aerolata TaxID=1656892 RepID=A0A849A415_9ACTN|nr:sodium:proton antiporter [Nakamurella aerolata]
MNVALGIGALALAVILFDRVAHRLGLSAPLVLMLVGIVASFLPFIPEVRLTEEMVLLGLLPPLLYSTAIRTSVVDFRVNIRVIGYLSVLLVGVTALAVGVVAWAVLDLPFAVAFALGAVVAPPDAVAATAVARKVGLPRPLVSILEGESLVNDASAITCLRTAIMAIGGVATVWTVGESFLLALVGGALIGTVVAAVAVWVRRRLTDAVTDTAISFVMPWAAYLPAEELHFGAIGSSGVIAVVTCGLILGHKAPLIQTAQSRMAERTNWSTIQFLLENAVFLLIGLQTRWIIQEVGRDGAGIGTVIGFCAAVFGTVVVVRMLWVLLGRVLLFRKLPGSDERSPVSWAVIVGWAGMRGVVTLAVAFLIPEDVPHRQLLLLSALVVTAGTLLIQGTTLPWLVRRLDVRGPDPRQDALAAATVLETAGREAISALDQLDEVSDETRAVVTDRIRRRTDQIWEKLGGGGSATPSDEYRRVRLYTLGVERQAVVDMRSHGNVDQTVLSSVLSALDVEESMLTVAGGQSERHTGDEVHADRLAPPECEHLRAASRRTEPTSDHCLDCDREGTVPVHLRMCLACGNVGCCDSSVGRHAERHSHQTEHPVMRSFEPNETWRWCYLDEQIG